jgi:hypothetical protein
MKNNRPPRKRERQPGDYAKMISRLSGRYDSLTDLPPNGKEGQPIVATSARRARGKVKANRKDPRNTCFGASDTLVTKADGTQRIIPRKAPRKVAERTTKRQQTKAQIVTEAIRYGATISLDERRKVNGL